MEFSNRIGQTSESDDDMIIDASMDNRYKSVTIDDLDVLADTEEEFDEQLTNSLDHWQSQGGRSV